MKGGHASSNNAGALLGPRAAAIPEPAAPVFLLPQEVTYDPATITTYAADCATPKSSFNFGDIVCAKVDGGYPLEISPRRVAWVGPDGVLRDQDQSPGEPFTYYAPVSTIGDTFTFTLPARDANVDERGLWRVSSVTSRSSVTASAYFNVSDPNDNVADLIVYNNVNTDINNVASGTNVEFAVWLVNRGPDAALNVELTNVVAANATFVNLQQDSGPSFTCPPDSAGPCTIARLEAGESAAFRYVYETSGTAAVGSAVLDTATVSSTTTEQNAESNSASAALAVTTTGGANPCSIVCPDNITKVADSVLNGQPGASVTFSNGEISGDCGGVTAQPASGSFFPVGTTTVTVNTGAGESCSFNVEITAAGAAPTISCPASINVDAGGDCSVVIDNLGEPTTSGGNGQLTVSATRSDGADLNEPFQLGTTTITWRVTDEATASSSCTQTVTVTGTDTEAPSITPPANITDTTGATATSCGKIIGESELGTAETADNCTGAVTVLRTGVPAGNFFPVGTTTITYRAKDAAGNLSAPVTQTVTVTDDAPPLITAPADPATPYVCPSDVPAANPADATLGRIDENNNQLPADNCGGTPTVAVTETRSGAGSASSPLIITRTFTATDSHGNSASDDQVITVIDNVAPTLALNGASAVTVECHTSWDDPGATASDNCADAGEVVRSGALDLNTPGTYTLTYNASDAAGNAAPPVTRTVTVVDTTKPVISLNGSSTMTVECHTTFTDPGASASDSCDSSVPVVVTGTVDAETPGTYTLTYNASDDSGNQADTVTRTVTVVDTIAPTITLKNVNISFWPPNHTFRTVTVADLVQSASDGCDETIDINDVFISQVSSDEAVNGNGDGNTSPDIVIAAACKSANLRAERAGNGNGRVYTITFKVRDASGNVGTATAKVTVPHSSNSAAVDSGAAYSVQSSCQ